jgi:hypothetical protein
MGGTGIAGVFAVPIEPMRNILRQSSLHQGKLTTSERVGDQSSFRDGDEESAKQVETARSERI